MLPIVMTATATTPTITTTSSLQLNHNVGPDWKNKPARDFNTPQNVPHAFHRRLRTIANSCAMRAPKYPTSYRPYQTQRRQWARVALCQTLRTQVVQPSFPSSPSPSSSCGRPPASRSVPSDPCSRPPYAAAPRPGASSPQPLTRQQHVLSRVLWR